MNIIKSRKGMTFVEVIITITVIAVLIPAIGFSVITSLKAFAWSKEYSDLCSVVSVIDGTIERELTLASGAVLDGDAISYYKNVDVKATFEPEADKVKVTVVYKGSAGGHTSVFIVSRI